MPFIEDDKYKLMQEDLDNAKLKREEADNDLTKVQESYNSYKKNSKITPIVFGVLFGIAAAAAYYFYSNSNTTTTSSISEGEIAAIKQEQTALVLDSIKRAVARARRNGKEDNNDINASSIDVASVSNAVNNKTKGKTVYAVQIGIFSKKKYPFVSKKFIPGVITPSNGYFKYSMGLFSTVNEAKYLRNELRKIGFEDAFVASYVNGKRKKIHH